MAKTELETQTVKLASLAKVKCPECGGPVNCIWFSNLEFLTGRAIFVAECWSGSLNKKSHYHIFVVKIPIRAIVVHEEEEE